MVMKKCPDCGEKEFFFYKQKGEVICKNCSYVVEDAMIDFGKETRAFDSDQMQKQSRSGAPFDPRIANNISTNIGNDSDLSRLPRSTQYLMRRIRKKNNWTSSSIERNLKNTLTTMSIVSSYLKLTERVEKEAAEIYRDAVKYGFTKARSCECTMVAALYAASRIHNLPKTLKEFSLASGIEVKKISKTYKLLLRTLEIKILPNNPADYLSRFTSDLNLSPKTQSKANELIDKARDANLTLGRSPLSIAATTLYLSALMNKEKVTQKSITSAAGISEITLRNRCKEVIRRLGLAKFFKGKIAF